MPLLQPKGSHDFTGATSEADMHTLQKIGSRAWRGWWRLDLADKFWMLVIWVFLLTVFVIPVGMATIGRAGDECTSRPGAPWIQHCDGD